MLTDDYELTRADIQSLSNRDALASFFATLDYDTNERLTQSIGAMGFTSDLLKSSILHIERLASEDSGLLEVYLIELKSVTVSITQALARAFRNLSVQFPLLVLTDDYQRLDFVLVERYTAATNIVQDNPTGFPAPIPRQVGVRPRVLTVNRLKPGDVELRVLRRFSYTQSDSFAQYDKLLSAYVVADWSEPFFNNRALFSDHYLIQRLPESPEWQNKTQAANMTRAFQGLRNLYADARETFANADTSITPTKLSEPALALLGFAAQPGAKRDATTLEPTYRLYPQAKQDIESPLALCLAYPWGRSLDGKDEQHDSETPDDNPGAVVVSLLDRGEANWAIVTNGKIWRLYSAKAHSRATNYYEIDLEETLAQPSVHRELAFRYFWYFFRAASLQPGERVIDGETRQFCFLDSLVSESERYAHDLGERLKERVFFEVFPHFARGFILHARQAGQLPANLEALSDEERATLLAPFFSGTLTFLYRLLFLLYAESRDMLPVRETRGYYAASLEKIKREIAEKAGTIEDQAPAQLKHAYNETSTAIYDRLQLLFLAVDKGNPEMNVPIYNGGLFITQPDTSDTSSEAAIGRFLATHKIPDRQLSLGLDRMARDLDEKKHDLVFIDYKSLGVRQLGSIYEGLLEFKLRVAITEMAVVKGKKTDENVPYAEALQKKLTILKEGRGKDALDRTFPSGTVYLENDRRERKATGSYYTPDYIVKYIVEHTVGPVLQEKLEGLRTVFREAEKMLRNQREKANALKKQRSRGDDPERETYLHYQKTLNEVFFDLKVLDPAMGSGHFLVEVVDYITDRMTDFLAAFRWNPIVYELAQTRHEIQEEMDRQNVSIDMSKLTDLNLLKRRVLKSCIYGVDLNQMAVELAKVSLWLDCFTLGAPLSFLDHHIKCGNSLIGGNVQEVQNALGSGLWGNQFTYLLDATHLMRKVGELSDVTAKEIAASKSAYKGAYDALAPFKRLLNVWLSEYFGNKGAKRITQDCADAIYNATYSELDKKEKQVVEAALDLAPKKHFFHWELEFPEVFFEETKRKENGGFDAVIGNPPYFSLSAHLPSDDISYISKAYSEIFAGNSDILYYFLGLIPKILKVTGLQGMIVSRYFQEAKYAQRLRAFLNQQATLMHLVDFQNFQIFGAEVNVLASIIIIRRWVNSETNAVSVMRLINDKTNDFTLSLALTSQNIHSAKLFETFVCVEPVNGGVWNFKRLEDREIDEKLVGCSLFLGDIATVVQSMQTGINEILAPSLETLVKYNIERELIHMIAKAGSILRFEFENLNHALIWTEGIDIDKYPNTKKYLQPFQDILAARYDIKSRKAKWWEISNPRNAELFFSSRPRILVPFIATGNKFCVDDDKRLNDGGDIRGIFFRGTGSPYSEFYICALLNSKTCQYYHLRNTKLKRGGYYEYFESQLSALPIRRITFTLSSDQRASALGNAKGLYRDYLITTNREDILNFANHHLSQQPEESDIVHDLLAFLTEEMIRLNKEKRAAQREFVDWLVGTLRVLPDKEGRVGIEALTGKAKLSDYPGEYQKGEPALTIEELLEILRKNKNRLGVSLDNTGLVDGIVRTYEESLQRVLPLKETLRQTDMLIDAVVYRLYGLTEEEIKVVEGKTQN